MTRVLPSAFEPTPKPLSPVAVAGIALVLVLGVALSVVEYLESTEAVEAAPKPTEVVPPQDNDPALAPRVTSTQLTLEVPYQGG